MDDYIKRSDAIEAISEECKVCGPSGNCPFIMNCLIKQKRIALYAVPSADVRPVKEGQWISVDAETEKCSHCKRRYYISALFAVGGNNEPDFCPGCGAYMGGDACAE